MKNWTQPDPVRNLIIDRAAAMGETLASLSKKIGKNHAYLQQFVQRGTPRELPERLREQLAPLLGVEPDALKGPFAPGPALRLPPSLLAQRPSPSRTTEFLHETIPLMGQGAAGRDGAFPFNGDRVADIPAPPSIARVRDAYAIYVVGDSMVPRFESGEIVFVDPTRPVIKGDYVVVQIGDDDGEGNPAAGYIKQYVGKDDRHLKLSQLNPKKQLSFPLTRVVSMDLIVLAGKT